MTLTLFFITVATYDLLFRRVPNWLLLTALGIHVGWLVITGHGLEGMTVSSSLLGGVIGLAFFLPLYALRAMGAGDVKFFALLGLMMGASALLPVWLIASIIAGAHALVWHVANKRLVMLPTWHLLLARVNGNNWYQMMREKRKGRSGIPYAAYLAIAALIVHYH